MEISVLARQVYEKQLQLGIPGLAKEVTDIFEIIKIHNINTFQVKKETIEEHVFYHHYKDMKENMEQSKKMEKIKHEDFRKEQDYMDSRLLDSCRTQLKVRLEMLDTFKDNFRTKY